MLLENTSLAFPFTNVSEDIADNATCGNCSAYPTFRPTFNTSILKVLTPMYWTLACAIVCANGALLLLYIRDATVRASLNYFVVSQIVTDTLVGLVTIPLVLIFPRQRLLGQTDVEDFACILTLLLQLSFVFMVPWGVAIIAVDRLVAVMRPSSYKFTITKRRSALALTSVWGFVLFFQMLPAMNLESVGGEKWRSYCSGHYRYPIAYLYAMSFLLLAAPILLTSVCYVTMYVVIKRKHSKSMVGPAGETHPSLQKAIKAAKTCLITTFLVALGWLPYLGTITVLPILEGVSFQFKFYAFCLTVLFAAAVSAANPLVYFHRSETVKKAFKQAIRNCFGAPRTGGAVSSILLNRNQVGSSVVVTQATRNSEITSMASDDQRLAVSVPAPLKPRPSRIVR